jgi:hypothetical protein
MRKRKPSPVEAAHAAPTSRPWAAPTILVLICVVTLTWAALRADAAWNFFVARQIIDNAALQGAYPPAVLTEAELRLQRALRFFPAQPDYLDQDGYVKILRSLQPGTLGRQRQELLEAAADDFRAALKSRPLWPYSWARLLDAKDRLDQVDSEFRHALRRSAETGPWEPQVQLQVIRTGIRHWQALGSADRRLVQTKIEHALKVQPREVFETVRFYARPDLVCSLEGLQTQIARWCSDFS